MKAVLKILGVILISMGVIILLAGKSAATDALGLIVLLLMGGIPAALGVLCLLKSGNKKQSGSNVPEQPSIPPMPEPEPVKASEPTSAPEPDLINEEPPAPKPKQNPYKCYSFKVAGISRRQRAIEENLVTENYEYSLSKKELVESGMIDERIYKYDPTVMDADLVPEPDNPKDPNAIKVLVDDVQIGYVPAEKTDAVKKLLSSKQVQSVTCEFYGGPFKIITEDYDDEKDKEIYSIEKESHYIGAEITIEYD